MASRLEDLERQNPAWRSFLGLLVEIEAELEGAVRHVTLDGTSSAGHSTTGVPLLDGRTVRADLATLAELLTRLLKLAGRGAPVDAAAQSLNGYRPDPQAARELLEAAVQCDDARIALTAETQGLDPGALATVLHLASVAVLAPCASALAGSIPAGWPHGYCPVCGSWPVLAEVLGVERERALRCGRCGAAWRSQWLHCTYCGEDRHHQLGALATADGLESRKAETCETCRQYLKAVAALVPARHTDLLLADLETVELDLAARDRGYGRPAEPGYRIACRLVAA